MFALIGLYAQKLLKKQLKDILKNKNTTGIVSTLNTIPAPIINKHAARVIIEFLIFSIDNRYEFFIMQ